MLHAGVVARKARCTPFRDHAFSVQCAGVTERLVTVIVGGVQHLGHTSSMVFFAHMQDTQGHLCLR